MSFIILLRRGSSGRERGGQYEKKPPSHQRVRENGGGKEREVDCLGPGSSVCMIGQGPRRKKTRKRGENAVNARRKRLTQSVPQVKERKRGGKRSGKEEIVDSGSAFLPGQDTNLPPFFLFPIWGGEKKLRRERKKGGEENTNRKLAVQLDFSRKGRKGDPERGKKLPTTSTTRNVQFWP